MVSMEWQPPDDVPEETPPSEFPPGPPEQEPPAPEEVPPPPKETPGEPPREIPGEPGKQRRDNRKIAVVPDMDQIPHREKRYLYIGTNQLTGKRHVKKIM